MQVHGSTSLIDRLIESLIDHPQGAPRARAQALLDAVGVVERRPGL